MVDPRSTTQLNTFINVWNDQSTKKSVQDVLKECQDAQEVNARNKTNIEKP